VPQKPGRDLIPGARISNSSWNRPVNARYRGQLRIRLPKLTDAGSTGKREETRALVALSLHLAAAPKRLGGVGPRRISQMQSTAAASAPEPRAAVPSLPPDFRMWWT